MTKRELFKRRVIELIHEKPYDEAIGKEISDGCIISISGFNSIIGLKCVYIKKIIDDDIEMNKDGDWIAKTGYKESVSLSKYKILGFPITIGRVMQALKCKKEYAVNNFGEILEYCDTDRFHHSGIVWKLTKENGQEADDDFQDDSTIEALYELIKI